MPSIENHVQIKAPLAAVYAALTTEAGVRGWWNARCRIHPEVGGESVYRFNKGGEDVHMRFRNAVLDPAGRVEWECVANDNVTWIGTTVRWNLRDANGGVALHFLHGGWADAVEGTDGFAMVVGGWQHFMTSLKSYVESGAGQPFA